ncbi:hypothetical protein HO133_001368 [Letharia lupina]|uniref:Uncharacterized protein n=1 Tax=Letharia lupina TaxID=560253 RepID=A0A8H6CEY0_9LECA|nr:uncharacterized protein HO133_001368 [Letharia lupina]KAF6222282.1 hypothetical protein HO133_001368 [Letharia lupina]
MYVPLTPLTTLFLLLLPFSALASRPHRPHRRFDDSNITPKLSTNTPSSPQYMAGTNQTFSAWTRSGCGNNTIGGENIWYPDLLYGQNNHALVVSYMLGRDLQPNEQLDMNFAYPDGSTKNGSDGVPIDKECALFQYTANPDQTTGATLAANTCYTPSVPVTCFNLWRTQ